jgi:hypothetical protein
MPQKLNKKIIIPAVLIGGGIALYFLNKSGKLDKLKNLIKGKEKEVEEEAPEKPVITNQTNIVTSNPLGSAADVKKFQEYYNSVKPAELPALSYDGWGPLTAAAYNSYKDKYAAAAAAGKLPAPPTPNKGIRVELADLLATNANAANNKMLYAGVTGIGIYNLNNVITDKTKVNTLLGAILSVIKTSNISYKIIFIKGTGIKYYINYYTQSPDHFYVKI